MAPLDAAIDKQTGRYRKLYSLVSAKQTVAARVVPAVRQKALLERVDRVLGNLRKTAINENLLQKSGEEEEARSGDEGLLVSTEGKDRAIKSEEIKKSATPHLETLYDFVDTENLDEIVSFYKAALDAVSARHKQSDASLKALLRSIDLQLEKVHGAGAAFEEKLAVASRKAASAQSFYGEIRESAELLETQYKRIVTLFSERQLAGLTETIHSDFKPDQEFEELQLNLGRLSR